MKIIKNQFIYYKSIYYKLFNIARGRESLCFAFSLGPVLKTVFWVAVLLPVLCLRGDSATG